ncbi:hypothetical protein ABZS86_03930 [Streptomyces sp. NPDC005355]|uniref:AMP-binding enzyme n=1 Tax=Streptomyces sp. NPDC005355 TaxID=3157038 RepID=UPI00339FAB54
MAAGRPPRRGRGTTGNRAGAPRTTADAAEPASLSSLPDAARWMRALERAAGGQGQPRWREGPGAGGGGTSALPAPVVAAAVIALPDPVMGERTCAVVVPIDAGRPPTLREVQTALRGRGAPHTRCRTSWWCWSRCR